MSDARVTFHDCGYALTTPGNERRFSFACPKTVGQRCEGLAIRQPNGKPRLSWEWNRDRERPTFSPSIDCQGCWYGFIENGRCVDTNKQEEPEPI